MMHYKGWRLTAQAREEILARCPATREAVRCDHVTLDLCRVEDVAPESANIRAYGVLDMEGYQVLAVTVDGKLLQPREDRLFHVTISHDKGIPSSHAGLLLREKRRLIRPLQSFMVPAIPFVGTVGPVNKP